MTPIEKAIQLQRQYTELQEFSDTIESLWEFSTDPLHPADKIKADKWIKKLYNKTHESIYLRCNAIQAEIAELIRQDKRTENIRLNKKKMDERRAAKSRKDQEQIPM